MNRQRRLGNTAARRRAEWLIVLLGLAAGIGLGLYYTWVIEPVEFRDTAPASLREDYKDDYMRLVARAYAVDGNLAQAQARLALLFLADSAQGVTALAQRSAAEGGPDSAVRELAALAAALNAPPEVGTPQAAASPAATGEGSPPAVGSTGTPDPSASASAAPTGTPSPTASATATASPEPTETVVPTITPRLLPTRTPTPTPLAAFVFFERQPVCDPLLEQPLIQVITQDRAGRELPGVEVNVVWEGGFDHFFTGLKPEIGPGYGDFTMSPGTVYELHLAESPSSTVEDLATHTCQGATGAVYQGSWRVIFRQP